MRLSLDYQKIISMKKVLIALFLLIIIYPTITFASWWNPFTWFKNTQPIKQKTNQIQNNIPVNTTQKQTDVKLEKKIPKIKIDNITSKIKEKTTSTIIYPTSVSIPTPVLNIDICKNIEGNQTFVPDNMYVDKDNCFVQKQQVLPQQEQQPSQEQIRDAQIKTLNLEYNLKINNLKQQIIDIKNQYYIDLKNIQSRPESLDFQQGQSLKLLNDSNDKIDQINLQIQQLYLDYMNKFNAI